MKTCQSIFLFFFVFFTKCIFKAPESDQLKSITLRYELYSPTFLHIQYWIRNTVFRIIYVSSKSMFAMTLKYMHKLLYKSYMRQHHFRDENGQVMQLTDPIIKLEDIENLMLCLSAGNNILKTPYRDSEQIRDTNQHLHSFTSRSR